MASISNMFCSTMGNFEKTLPLAEAGDSKAQFTLGYMFAEGDGVPKSDQEAARWYRKAANQGHQQAQNCLAFMYRDGLGGLPQSFAMAQKWWAKADRSKHKKI